MKGTNSSESRLHTNSLHTNKHMNSFHSLETRGEKTSDYGLLPVTTGFTMATVSRGLCVCRSEAGDPAALRFSMTHNINHFIEVGQILLEIHLKCGGTAEAGGRHCAWERRTKPPRTAGSCRRWAPHGKTSVIINVAIRVRMTNPRKLPEPEIKSRVKPFYFYLSDKVIFKLSVASAQTHVSICPPSETLWGNVHTFTLPRGWTVLTSVSLCFVFTAN